MSELRFAYQTQNIKIKLRNNAETRVSQCIFRIRKRTKYYTRQEKKTATIINFTKTVFYTEALKVFLHIKILDINSVYICIMYNKCVNPRYCIEIKFSLRNNAETQQQSISNLNLKVNVSSIV